MSYVDIGIPEDATGGAKMINGITVLNVEFWGGSTKWLPEHLANRKSVFAERRVEQRRFRDDVPTRRHADRRLRKRLPRRRRRRRTDPKSMADMPQTAIARFHTKQTVNYSATDFFFLIFFSSLPEKKGGGERNK